MQAHPAVSDGIFTRARGVRVRLLGHPKPHFEAFRIRRIPPPSLATSMIGEEVKLMAVLSPPVASPEWEAAVRTEAVSIGWNERDVALSGHDAHLIPDSSVTGRVYAPKR